MHDNKLVFDGEVDIKLELFLLSSLPFFTPSW